MAAHFNDSKGREWTVYITGETIEAAAARGIDLSADFVRGIMAAVRSSFSAPSAVDLPQGQEPTPEQRATLAAAEAEREAEAGKALLELGSSVLSLRLAGTLISLCWLGCRHNARVQADKVTEQEFKRGLHGESLIAACVATFNALAACFNLPLQLGGQEADPTPAAKAAGGKKK